MSKTVSYHPFNIIKIISSSFSIEPLNLIKLDSNTIFYKNIKLDLINSLLNDIIGTFDEYYDNKYIDLTDYYICCSKIYELYKITTDSNIPEYFIENLYNILKNILPNILNYNLYTFKNTLNNSLFYVLEPIFLTDKENIFHSIGYTVYNLVYDNWFIKNNYFLNQ